MKTLVKLMFTALAAAALVSCASAPQPSPGPTESAAAPTDITQVRKAAEDARSKALDIKANVASKAIFEEAEAAYNGAKAFEKNSDAEKATAGYKGATDIFTKAYNDAAAKKEAATKAMATAAAERKSAEDAISKAADEQAGVKKGE
jgi:hypothetical protein